MGMSGQRHVPTALPPEKRPGTPCTECYVGLRNGLDGCGKSLPHRDSIQPLGRLYRLRYSGLQRRRLRQQQQQQQ